MPTTTPKPETAPATRPGCCPRSRAAIALLLLVPAPTLGVLAAMFIWPDTTLGQALYQLAKLWILILPILWLLKAERTRPRLPRWSWQGMPAGLITGLLTVATIVAAWELFAQHWVDVSAFQTKMQEIGLSSPIKFLGFAAAVTLINAILEEYVWRWFVYTKWFELLKGFKGPAKADKAAGAIGLPGAGAIVLAGLCFTLHHSVAMSLYFDWKTNLLASTGVFVGGVTWSILYLRYKNIYAGYISHIFADVALFYVGYQVAFGG